jgi:hypothetical protein
MKDARVVLDNVRRVIPPNAKVLVVWVDASGKGAMHCAQANMALGEIEQIAASLQANAATEKLRVAKG